MSPMRKNNPHPQTMVNAFMFPKRVSSFDTMGPWQLSDHVLQYRQTGEQMTPWDMLNKENSNLVTLLNMAQCVICSPVWRFCSTWSLSCNGPIWEKLCAFQQCRGRYESTMTFLTPKKEKQIMSIDISFFTQRIFGIFYRLYYNRKFSFRTQKLSPLFFPKGYWVWPHRLPPMKFEWPTDKSEKEEDE